MKGPLLAVVALVPACQRAPLSLPPPDPSVRPPFVLWLTGPPGPPLDGDVVLTAALHGQPGVTFPIDLELVLPPGAVLRRGELRERLVLTREAPSAERRYEIRLAGREPVRLRARLADPALGAFAERIYPPPPPVPAAPSPGPGEPVGRLPVGTPVEIPRQGPPEEVRDFHRR